MTFTVTSAGLNPVMKTIFSYILFCTNSHVAATLAPYFTLISAVMCNWLSSTFTVKGFVKRACGTRIAFSISSILISAIYLNTVLLIAIKPFSFFSFKTT